MGQKKEALIEWVSCYGWGILIILSFIGILFYYGILSPDNFLPKDSKVNNACEIKCEEIGETYSGIYNELDNGSFACKCQTILTVNMNKTNEGLN